MIPVQPSGGSQHHRTGRPASVAQLSVPPKQPSHDALALATHARPPLRGSTHKHNRGLCLPQARAPRFVSAQALAESKRCKLTDQFRNIMLRVGSHCLLHGILAESTHPEQHVERLLAAFTVNTLFRYIACCLTFLDFMQAQHLSMESIPVALLVDFLHAALSSKRQDRAVHRTSCGAAIKALRWLAKHLQWQALQLCAQNNLVTSYSKQVEAYDKREAVPLPLSLVLAWEQCICRSDAPLTTKLVLGAILVCTRSSIRFGDAQRVRWGSLQLSTQGLHATAYATKTTKAGQPFFCAWHGLSGRDASTSWLLHWLAALASIPKAIFEVHADTVEPDYLFPHLDMHCISVEYLAPASYTRTLLCLRWAAQSSMLSGSASLTLTLRSMKSTALASAAQLRLSRDDRLSQGHHRDSARLYSRNDTFASLRIQRSIALAIADGWRPQRSMARGGSAPVPEPPFTAPRTHPAEHLSTSSLLEGPWRIFTSRHESIHATQELADSSPVSSPASTGPAVPPEDPAIELDKASDPEAEAVEEYALLHGSSESEAEATALHVDLDARTYVCSGPWGSMHVPTAESLQAYTLALPKLGSLAVCKLRAACGAHLGPASFVAVCKEPVSLCRRKACLAACNLTA